MPTRLVLVALLLLASTAAVRADAPCPGDALTAYCSTLDASQPPSATMAADRTAALMADADDACRSSLIDLYRGFFKRSMKEYGEAARIERTTDAAAAEKISRDIERFGWQMYEKGGKWYLDETPAYLLDRFGPLLPADWKLFLEISAKEIRRPAFHDDQVLVEWDELRARLERWEGFTLQHPGFPRFDEVHKTMRAYLVAMLSGTARTRPWDGRMVLLPEAREALERFISRRRNSRYYKVVSDYYGILKENNFRMTGKAFELLDPYK